VPTLTRTVLGALVATVVVPVLAATPASAATTVTTPTSAAVSAAATRAGSPTAATELTAPSGLCRLFPKMCAKVSPSAVGPDA